MQGCTDCGHSNRSGVHFCTHCGKPVVASGASLSGPTTIVAAVVLAIGLLAFLTIRPVASTQSAAETFPSPPSALQDAAAADDGAAHDAQASEHQLALPAPAPTSLEPAEQAADGSTAQVDAMPGLDPSLASLDVIQAPSSELMTPASSSASPLVLQAAPALSGQARALDAAHEERPSVLPVRPPAQRSPVASSPVAKRATVESGAQSDGAPARAKARESWLRTLHAKIEACDGNFIVRTICAERAKMRHCTSADAWGEVPECPAAPPTELATFN